MPKVTKYKISVVSAVYNVEKYLGEMVESIISQTIGFENIQLILVDDGSEDGSGVICDRYAERYPDNIVSVHKENGGVSSARNEGLRYVQGKYLNFIDADDMLENTALEKMYDLLKKNEEWIDLVAIKMIYFEKRSGDHPLNYKFKKTRIVDLRKNYSYIQLSLSSALVKRECFQHRRFDTGLCFAEDAQNLIDILLEKMRYGVVSDTSYLYRKRGTEDSAIDTGRDTPHYYIPYMERFILYSLENALNKRGYIPRYVQYTCMYDLQWRLKKEPLAAPGILTAEETERYKKLLVKAIRYIDDPVIFEQKYIAASIKATVLSLKDGNRGYLEFYPDDVKFCIKDLALTCASSYHMFYEFFDISPQEIQIEGYVRYFAGLGDVEVVLKTAGGNGAPAEYKAGLLEREEKSSFCVDKKMVQARGFCFHIERERLPQYVEAQLYLRYQGRDILCKRIGFGKFFPISMQLENSYFYQDGIFLAHSKNRLLLRKVSNKGTARKYEWKLTKEILRKRDMDLLKGWIYRKIVQALRPLKKKEIWLVSDRLTKADDNGEAFFTYINQTAGHTDIDPYFVLDKSSADRERLDKIGKVISYKSIKYRILSLLCDKIISAQADDYVFDCFPGSSYLYKDIVYGRQFIFLQHGIIKDDLSGWLAKDKKNIRMFVTSTQMEYRSVLNYPYHYDSRQVKLTGLPRYDHLYDDPEHRKVITFMPTWRQYLAGRLDISDDSRILKDGFEDSPYCQMYRQVFSDPRLCGAAKKYHYRLKLMLHPAMPGECVRYFQCGDAVEILDRSTRYRDIFAVSRLVVTDYSSTVFDHAYLRKPVLYYQQDVDEFFSGKHSYSKGYFDYERDGFGEVSYTAAALVDRLIEYMENGCQLKDVYRERIEKTFCYNDRDNCKRVYEEILRS